MAKQLDAGASVDVKDPGGGTALVWASAYGYTPVVSLLLSAGADVDARPHCGSALTFAASHGHAHVVTLLLQAGADVGIIGGEMTERQTSSIHEAAQGGNVAMVSALIKAGRDVLAISVTPSAIISARSRRNFVSAVPLLLAAGMLMDT
jgi:hypothetical protein